MVSHSSGSMLFETSAIFVTVRLKCLGRITYMQQELQKLLFSKHKLFLKFFYHVL